MVYMFANCLKSFSYLVLDVVLSVEYLTIARYVNIKCSAETFCKISVIKFTCGFAYNL